MNRSFYLPAIWHFDAFILKSSDKYLCLDLGDFDKLAFSSGISMLPITDLSLM